MILKLFWFWKTILKFSKCFNFEKLLDNCLTWSLFTRTVQRSHHCYMWIWEDKCPEELNMWNSVWMSAFRQKLISIQKANKLLCGLLNNTLVIQMIINSTTNHCLLVIWSWQYFHNRSIVFWMIAEQNISKLPWQMM